MSSDSLPNDVVVTAKPRGDYTTPIARTGEQQFAAIVRNRSGQDAGCIDFGARDVRHLCPAEQQDIVNTAFALYETYVQQTGKRAVQDI